MSTKDYGCFYCDGKSSDYSGKCEKCGELIEVFKGELDFNINGYKAIEVIGRGFYGWTLKVEDDQPFAMKMIPQHRLINKKELADKEVKALVVCSSHRNICRFWRQLKDEVQVNGKSIPVLCLVFDYLEKGRTKTLREIIEDDNLRLERGDIVDIISGIASGLVRLHSRGLWHDDLHDENVLVRLVEPDDNLTEKYEPKLIDFGSVKPIIKGEPERGERSDYYYLSKHIYGLISQFEYGNRNNLTPSDRDFVSRLRKIGHILADRNISRRNIEPSEVVSRVHQAYDECMTGHRFPTFEEIINESRVSLTEPLANTNAITLAPQDIALLFRDSLEWESRLLKSEPVLVVGPRGCGKTMLLRYLSASSQARLRKEEKNNKEVQNRLDSMPYIGFLVSFGELRTPFLRSAYKELENTNVNLAEEYCREYFNANVASEILRTISWLHNEKLASISRGDLRPLCMTIYQLLTSHLENGAIEHNIDDVITKLDRYIMKLSSLASRDYKPTELSRDDVLLNIAKAIKATSWGKAKEVWFLFDDYSPTVIPSFAIRSYNPVIFRLSADLKIKISSEGEGPMLDDTLSRKYKEGRELTKVNLGEVYFQQSEDLCFSFFKGILEVRFSETGKGSIEQLETMLGEHEHEANFGKYICERKRPGDSRFYGLKLLCQLCSGDVSDIIEMLHTITKGRWNATPSKIPIKEQDEIVKLFSRRQLANLRGTAEYGHKLYEFAEGLGKLIKEYLIKSKDKGTADERLRIEIEGTGLLSPQAQLMQNELLRHSVLIPGGAGKSRKGLPTKKLYFRRLYAPCFPFSPTRSGSIPLTVEDYEEWLLDPKAIWETPPDQPSLFSSKS